MESPTSLLKIPLLLGIVWANHVTYTSPNPVVRKPDAPSMSAQVGYATINMRPPWVRSVSKFVVRGVVAAEVVAIAATHFSANTLLGHTFILPSPLHCPNIRLPPSFLAGWTILVAGALIRKACYRSMGRHFTFEVTVQKDHRLVTSGPYSFVRHPSYTALSMVVFGSIACLLGWGSWLTECGILETLLGKAFVLAWLADLTYVPLVMVFSRVKTEDEMLRRTFGKEWEEWASRTPCALVPGCY